MEPIKEQTPKATAMPKYKIKGGKASISYPGFKHEVTKDHLEGENAELFVAAFKKLDAKSGNKNFDLLIEEVK